MQLGANENQPLQVRRHSSQLKKTRLPAPVGSSGGVHIPLGHFVEWEKIGARDMKADQFSAGDKTVLNLKAKTVYDLHSYIHLWMQTVNRDPKINTGGTNDGNKLPRKRVRFHI